MKVVRIIVGILPWLWERYERLCAKTASNGDGAPTFSVSTLFLAPLGLWLWRRPVARRWVRVPGRLAAYAVLLLAARVFVAGFWVLFFASVAGWLARLLAWVLRFRERRVPPEVPRALSFPLTRLDRAALVFIAVILLVFFVNRDQMMPRDDSDHNYHMAVARQILEQKRVPVTDDWEFAPAGRPHLYPPALHVLIAMLAGRPDNVVGGFQTLQVLTYPLALFLTWWFARWLFGPRMGLVAALLFSMAMHTGWSMIVVLPSAVVTALLPLVMMCFLTKRKAATAVLLTLSLYAHLGVPAVVLLGLHLFAARHRGYFRFFQSVLTWSVALWLPWVLTVILPQLSWLGVPSTRIAEAGGRTPAAWLFGLLAGMLMLQGLNPILLALQFWGLFRLRGPRTDILRCMLVGFLPALVLYGGRYWMHTAPVWSIFAASVAVRLVPKGATRRRLAAVMLATLVPLPTLFITPGLKPKLHVGFGGSFFALAYVLTPAAEDEDINRLAEYIERHTKPREIVHVDPARMYLGDRIVHATGRRVDTGGWSAEVRTDAMTRHLAHYREVDNNCLFVYEKAEVPDALGCCEAVRIGRFNVGIRGKEVPLDEQTHPDEAPPAR